jgi:hypothetical protein
MSVRNQNWYNLQSTRRYPLDDASTGEDDNGGNLRDSILVDCHIRAPADFGPYFYIQGLTISDTLISVVIGAATSLTATENTTICAATVLKPTAEYVNIPVTPIQAGVAGWRRNNRAVCRALQHRAANFNRCPVRPPVRKLAD